MSVPGNWTLHYDWNTTGHYASTPMTIAPNNTWSNGEGYHGTWAQVAGILTFQFNNLKTTYSGNLADKSVTGINSTFGGTQRLILYAGRRCWGGRCCEGRIPCCR